MLLEGGCLCGSLRYRVETDGAVADLCHCETCRRASGAPFVAWLQVPPSQFRLLRGEPASYRSSSQCRRHFCKGCGAQLYMTDEAGRSVGITLASLDDPEAVRPVAQGFYASCLSWVGRADELPRYPGPPPYDEE